MKGGESWINQEQQRRIAHLFDEEKGNFVTLAARAGERSLLREGG